MSGKLEPSSAAPTKRLPARTKPILYSHPLPLPLSLPPSLISYIAGFLHSIPSFENSPKLLPDALLSRPCVGRWDPSSRTIWVTNPEDILVLWRRGFFGKGSLSRSEPSWLARERTRLGFKQGDRRCPRLCTDVSIG
jgi:tRNA-splicing endonuclease subunit Sen2